MEYVIFNAVTDSLQKLSFFIARYLSRLNSSFKTYNVRNLLTRDRWSKLAEH